MKVISDFEYCVDSPDYISPIGATHDDTTSIPYIKDIETYFNGQKLTTIELGCAGGRIVMDMIERGHDSYGLEGTHFPLKLKRPAWVKYYGKNLFNCDLSKPFTLLDDNDELMQFDVISHWEFLEHIPTESIDLLLANLYRYLKDDGIILCGVSPWGPTTNPKHGHQDLVGHVVHHQSCFMQEEWNDKYFNRFFEVHQYPFDNKLRPAWNYKLNIGSFYTMLKKKTGVEDMVNNIIENE